MKMKFFLLAALLGFGIPAANAQHRPLLPRPQEISYNDGTFALDRVAVGFAMKPNSQDDFAARQLAASLTDIIHDKVEVRRGKTSGRGLILNRTGNGPDLPVDNDLAGPGSREAYSITISAKGAEISAPSSAGLFYGAQTLLQMVEGQGRDAVLPFARVRDWPAMAYRGFMMDFSEGQLLRLSEVKRQLDLLARFKANQYYFYSEMSIEWPGYEMVTPEGRFTQAQVREIIAYARDRHIDVVPCIELFGHMHALFRMEKFAGLGLPPYGEEFDQRNPRTLPVVDDLFDKTSQLFPSPWIHVGFDEPWSLGKIGLTPGKNPFDTFIFALQHLADRAASQGKRLMYWADINNGASTLSNHPELISRLPKGAIAGPWEYDAVPDYTPFIQPLATNHIATMVTPAIWNWNEVYPDYHRTFTDINGMVQAGLKLHALGVINTGWTDCAQTLYRQSLPGLAFGAIAGWQTEPVNTNSFFTEYCQLTYPAEAAPEIAAAMEQLSTVEQMFEDILDNATQHGFWADPLAPGHLARLEKKEDQCHKARLLAEEAVARLIRAEKLAPGDPTLPSMMMAARLFDYLGMKCLYAVQWDGYFKKLRENPDPQLVTLYIGIQINQQGNGMLADLIDTITDLREPYRQAWLAESSPYRLGTALARWDRETRFWFDTWGRVNQFLHTRKKGDPFPSIDVLRAKDLQKND